MPEQSDRDTGRDRGPSGAPPRQSGDLDHRAGGGREPASTSDGERSSSARPALTDREREQRWPLG